MKSKLLKTVVLASSLVFLNCGDDVTSAISDFTASLSSSSAGEVQPGTSSDSRWSAGAEISSSDAAQPTSGTTLVIFCEIFFILPVGENFCIGGRILKSLSNKKWADGPFFSLYFYDNLWITKPLRSFGSNHVVFGGMMLPVSAMSMI